MARWKWTSLCVAGVFLCFAYLQQVRAMTSTNYQVNWDSVNSGGIDTGTSTNYQMLDTIGEQATGYSTSVNYTMHAGYRQADETSTATLSFRIGTQENVTQRPYTAFSTSTRSVTVSATSSFSVGDFVVAVENEGASQLVATGKITAVSGTELLVDAWGGSAESMATTPGAGTNVVYRANGYAAALGILSAANVKTSVTMTRVSSDASNGFTVFVHDDGNLRYTTDTFINNVVTGPISAGTEDYGFQVFGVNASSTGSDLAFTTTTQPIQHASTILSDDSVALVYKAAASAVTVAGNYAQNVYFTITLNY